MSLQGSIHTWSDGIGYGAFIPIDRAYYNVSTPRASWRRPSSEQLREYRRQNVTGGIDTHRSDISFGKATESVHGGREGDLRAREATKSLTSGEVGGFIWPAERAREGDVETILVSSSAAASNQSVAESSLPVSGCRGSNHGAPPTMLSPHSVKQHEKAAEAQAVSARERRHRPPQQEQEQEQQKQQQLRGGGLNETPARSRASTSSKHGGGSTHRSDSTCAPSSSSSSIGSYSRSRPSSFRSTATSSSTEIQNTGRTSISGTSSRSSRSGSSTRSKRRTPRPTSYDATNQGAALATAEHQLSHRSSNAYGNVSSAREHRLRPPTLRAHRTPPPPTRSSARSATSRLSPVRALDPVFDRHHKYDLIAEETAAQGGEVTGRFGKVHGSSVLAASQLTSELSTPWSHVLRGQKW